jgi:hypothetical protein
MKLTLILTLSLGATVLYAEDSTQNASEAGKHSTLATSEGITASTKIASGVVAVPLIVSGGSAQASTAAGDTSMQQAGSEEPLEITEKTVTADPAPQTVMKTENKDE